MAVKLDKTQIYDGIWKTKDLAELLDISPSTFRNNREKWLGYIRRIADVEEVNVGEYFITVKKD